MNRSPDREIDVHHPPSLAGVRRARDGDFEAVTPPLRSDEASVQQELLQVADEPWSIDEDVQAARGAPEWPQRSRLLSLSSKQEQSQGLPATRPHTRAPPAPHPRA